MTNNRVPTVNVKDSAKALRGDLKIKFGLPFSVTMSRGTGYGWVRVAWQDGPRTQDVINWSDKYQDQRFDGMTDSYRPVNTDAPVRYSLSGVNHAREIGPKGHAFLVECFRRAGIADFEQDMPSGCTDMNGAFRSDRFLTDEEMGRLIRAVGDDQFNSSAMQDANRAAWYLFSRTDFTGDQPVYGR